MKPKFAFFLLSAVLAVFSAGPLFAQGTVFTYQGRLDDNGNPANGNYNFQFTIYNSSGGGGLVAGPVTNSAVAVSNGLFVVNLDFGPGVFTGPARWLDIGVQTNGSTNGFAILSPRQLLTPTPYAIFANTASNLSGTLPTAQLVGLLLASNLSGTLPASAFVGYTNTVALTNSGNLFAGSFSGSFAGGFDGIFNGIFNGNGGDMTNVNVTHLTGVLADNQLPANTAFVDSNQTFSGANHFTGPNNFSGTNFFSGPNVFTNSGNSFVGSFFGNGLVGWVPTNGTIIQAQIDHGYLLTNSQPVTVTLPPSPNVGDIVRISGPGGWLIAQNANQAILGNFNGYTNSSWIKSGANAFNWDSIASSANGSRMVAAAGATGAGVYISTDSGRTWGPSGASSGSWQAVASSADGSKLAACLNNSTVYTSTNSGTSWQQRTTGLPSPGTGSSWTAIASSADGTRLVAVGNSGIYLSTDSGASWSQRISGSTWTSVASSADGTRMVAANGTVYISSNGGSSWSSTSQSGSYVASSDDGTKLVTAGSGGIYTSTDFGSTWTHRTTGLPGGTWSSVALSSDGELLAATLYNGGIYTSVNGGAAWTQQSGEPNAAWWAITSSANGTALTAVINNASSGGIYTMQASTISITSIGTAGGIAGGQGAVELQYIGNNRFIPISSAGNIWAY